MTVLASPNSCEASVVVSPGMRRFGLVDAISCVALSTMRTLSSTVLTSHRISLSGGVLAQRTHSPPTPRVWRARAFEERLRS